MTGEIVGDVVEVRFAFGGLVARVHKKVGDRVEVGEIIAALDRTILQNELDRELANYEKVRAEFEIFAKHHPNPGDDLTKYAKQIEQAQLNASVKGVEMAKIALDRVDVKSPVEGVIVESTLLPGLYITPASHEVKIFDLASIRLRINLEQDELAGFLEPKNIEVKVAGRFGTLMGQTKVLVPGRAKFYVEATISDTTHLYPGMKVDVKVV